MSEALNDQALAQKIQKELANNRNLTINDLAIRLETAPYRVKYILDEFLINDSGSIDYAGPGRGGNWT